MQVIQEAMEIIDNCMPFSNPVSKIGFPFWGPCSNEKATENDETQGGDVRSFYTISTQNGTTQFNAEFRK